MRTIQIYRVAIVVAAAALFTVGAILSPTWFSVVVAILWWSIAGSTAVSERRAASRR